MSGRIPFALTLLAGIAAHLSGQSPYDPLNARGTNRNSLINHELVPDLDKKIPGTLNHPHTYDITPEAGQWAILVTSYSGPNAGPLALDFVSELRKDYKLPGYFYNRSEEARKQEKERLERLHQERIARYEQAGIKAPEKAWVKHIAHIEAQYAVLIADPKFKTLDDARHALNAIRKLKSPSERLMNHLDVTGKPDAKSEVSNIGGFANPFLTAFVVPNPTLPPPKPATSASETIANLRHLNSAEEFSLFKCPGNWTLVVKSYQGASMVVSKDAEKSVLEKLGFGGDKQGDLLEASGRQAHQLAEILRNKQLNFESYVLHMRNSSIVTVGSFDSEKDPRMQQMMDQITKLHLAPYETLSPPTPFRVPK